MKQMILTGAIILISLFGVAIIAFIYNSSPRENDKKDFAVGDTVFKVDVADNMVLRGKGLSGREPLLEKEGLVFLFGTSTRQSFWMDGMKFAIDIIWIRDGKIIGFTKNAPPPEPGQSSFTLPTYSPENPYDTVLEVLAGSADKFGLEIGDTAEFK